MIEATVQLTSKNELLVNGHYNSELISLLCESHKKIKKAFRQIGGFILPGTFTVSKPGADVHYSSTLPMIKKPRIGQTSINGEVYGLNNVFIVDGSCLPTLKEKPHTLTMMANADRIGRFLVNKIREM